MTTTTPTAVTNFQSVNTTARLGNSVDSIKLSDGTYIVVYAIDDGNGGSTVVAQQIDEIGNTIGGEMTLGSSASGSGIDFSVTAFENNQIVLAFEDDGAIQIDAFTIVDGVATADPAVSQTITGTGGSILREPRLTGDTLADLKLHYTETTGTTVVAVEQRDVVNGAFTNTTDLFSSPGNANAELVSAQLANGNTVVVVDDDGDGGAANWDVQIVAPDGTQVSQFTHLSDGGSRMSDPAVAGLANGGFVIAFRDADNDDDLYMRIYDDTGNLVVNLLGFDETGDASDSSLNPEVLALSDGSFVAFYFDDRDDQLRMKRFDENGVEIGNEITIDTGNNFDGISATLLDDGLLAITVTDANGAIVTQTRAFESDRLFEGTDGDDTFTATSGDDTILGTLGDDTINGGDGDDFFSSGEGDDSYNGGAGTDTLSFADETEALFVDMLLGEVTLDDFEEAIESQFENFEIVIGTDFGDTINSDVGDTIFGGAGDDVLLAQVGPANLFGGTGNDRIATNSLQVASTEFSVFDGGEGIDTLDFGGDTFSTSTPVTVDLAAGSVTSAAHSVFISGFENVEGSNGADDISGDANDNQIFGFLGADTILGRDGNDSIFGGSGDDTLTGDDGDTFSVHLDNDDVISGGDGDDTVFGGNGVDSISGGEGEDSIQGGEGDDFIEGDAGNDIIIGNDGADLIFGGEGVDTIFAGNGDDSLSGDAGNDGIYAGAGDDTLFGGDGNDNAFGGDGDDVIDLGAGLNSASGGAGTDIITGGDDQDTISGDGGADTLFGGDGDDNLFGGEGQDVVFGGLGDDIIGEETFGGSNGADILNGDEGNDILIGGNGTDILNGGADNDTLFGGSDADTLTGGDGDDTIAGGTGDDMIIAGLGADSLFGGNGIDTVDYSASGASIEVELESSAEDTGSGIGGFAQGDTFSLIENVIGTDFNDQITGNVFDNVFTGGDGNDILDGAEGDDELFGGAGDDVLVGGDGDDTLDGGAGTDTARFIGVVSDFSFEFDDAENLIVTSASGDTDTLTDIEFIEFTDGVLTVADLLGNVPTEGDDILDGDDSDDVIDGLGGDDVVSGFAGNDDLSGGEGNDQIFGDNGLDNLFGGTGDDSLFGGNGADTIDAGDGTDFLAGGNGADVMFGLAGKDHLRGQAGEDSLVGGSGADRLEGGGEADVLLGGNGQDKLFGGNGRDVLDGGVGDDLLNGGVGSDTFVFSGTFGNDTLQDFDATDNAEDIDLSGVASITDFADLSTAANGHMFTSGSDVIIDDLAGNTIRLVGVDISDLNANDFLF